MTKKHNLPAIKNSLWESSFWDSVGFLRPGLLKDWVFEENKIDPKKIYRAAVKSVWWKCKDCGYSWKTRIRHRTTDSFSKCPQCSGFILTDSNRAVAGFTKYSPRIPGISSRFRRKFYKSLRLRPKNQQRLCVSRRLLARQPRSFFGGGNK